MRKGIGEHRWTRVQQAGTRELRPPILGRLLYQVNNFDELLASWARYDVRSLPPRRTLAEHRAPCRDRVRSAAPERNDPPLFDNEEEDAQLVIGCLISDPSWSERPVARVRNSVAP
jgi:hypothetical protein